MIYRLAVALMLCKLAFAEVPWECRGDSHYVPEQNAYVTSVEDAEMYKWADRKVLPNVSDLKEKRIGALITVRILVGTDGSVRCARSEDSDSQLVPRSVEAARKWHYKSEWLKRNAVNVETKVVFLYSMDTVKSVPVFPRWK